MKDNLNDFYDTDFYSEHMKGMSKSSEVILKLLYEVYKPKSVIDVGCGQGAWLASAEVLGSTTLKGLDGKWVNQEALLSKNIDFSAVNFEEAIPAINTQYDLCMSLEVAEHLSEDSAKSFIDFLCKTSNVVLFSAAIKDQGGTNHINEQWQSYWIDLFKLNGYQCLDVIRPNVWNDDSVDWWYAQNTFLFISPENAELKTSSLQHMIQPIYNTAHPKNYKGKVGQAKKKSAFKKLRHKIKHKLLK